MSPAQRFMHADAGGYLLPSCIASLSTVSKITSKTISKAINACPDLSKGEKRMLSEVCSFVHVGKRGVCDAKNAHFVNECLIAKDSVSRILTRLENKGLVTVDPGKERGNKRLIWPTKRALALYMMPEQLAEVPGSDNVDSLSTKVDTPIDQIMQTLSTFVDTPIDFLQGGLSTFSGEAIDFLRDALLIVKEKYLKEVEERGQTSIAPSSSSSVEPALVEEIVTTQPASPNAEPQGTRGAAAGAPHELPRVPWSQSKYATLEGLSQLAHNLSFGKAYAPYYLAHITSKAEDLAPRPEIGRESWKSFAQSYLTNDARSKTGLVTQDPVAGQPQTPQAGVGNLAARAAKQSQNDFL